MLEQKSRIVLDLRPGLGNPRNSEGAFLELKDGSLLFVYSRFTGDNPDDTALAHVAARRSTDRGETWSEDEIVAKPEEHGALNLMSVSLLRMVDGDIGLFYLIRYGWHDTRLHLRRSSDEGRTWSEPVCCIPKLGYYVTNNDRVVRLSSGRLIVPASLHNMRYENTSDWKYWDGRGIVHFYLSDDDGMTWREAKHYCAMPHPRSQTGLQEPGAVELENGVLWSWSRTDMGFQYESFSLDQGETWSMPVPSAFTSPASPLSMKRIPGHGHLLAVWNPIPDYVTREKGKASWGRAPLIAAVSRDDGKSWGDYFTLEGEETGGGYCYTAIHFTADAVLFAYCAGEEDDGICLARLKIRKVSLADLL